MTYKLTGISKFSGSITLRKLILSLITTTHDITSKAPGSPENADLVGYEPGSPNKIIWRVIASGGLVQGAVVGKSSIDSEFAMAEVVASANTGRNVLATIHLSADNIAKTDRALPGSATGFSRGWEIADGGLTQSNELSHGSERYVSARRLTDTRAIIFSASNLETFAFMDYSGGASATHSNVINVNSLPFTAGVFAAASINRWDGDSYVIVARLEPLTTAFGTIYLTTWNGSTGSGASLFTHTNILTANSTSPLFRAVRTSWGLWIVDTDDGKTWEVTRSGDVLTVDSTDSFTPAGITLNDVRWDIDGSNGKYVGAEPSTDVFRSIMTRISGSTTAIDTVEFNLATFGSESFRVVRANVASFDNTTTTLGSTHVNPPATNDLIIMLRPTSGETSTINYIQNAYDG